MRTDLNTEQVAAIKKLIDAEIMKFKAYQARYNDQIVLDLLEEKIRAWEQTKKSLDYSPLPSWRD